MAKQTEQLEINFEPGTEVTGELIAGLNSGKRRVTYRNCTFTGECRTGAYCTLIDPVIKGVLRTGGHNKIVRPVMKSEGKLLPGADNEVSAY